MIKKVLSSIFLGGVAISSIASDTSAIVPQNTFKLTDVVTQVKTLRPVVNFWAISGSNAVPLSMASKFITGGYISPNQMQDYESKLSETNRMGFMQDLSVLVYPIAGLTNPVEGIALQQISLGTLSLGGLTFTKDAFGIFFRGNTPYLGEKKELGSNNYLQLRQRYVEFDFKLPLKVGKWKFSSTVKLSQVLDYQKAQTNALFMETDVNADSIVLGGNFYSQQTGYDFWGTGVGLQAGISAYKPVNRGYLTVNISDLGVLSVNGIQRQSRGYEWTENSLKASGELELANVNIQSVGLTGTDIKVSNWFDRQRDTVEARLNIVEGEQRGTVFAPFVASVNYGKYYIGSKIRGFRMGIQYIHMVGFIPRISGDVRWSPGGNINLTHGVSIGGFDNFDINSSVSFYAGSINNDKIMWDIYLRGIESFIVPSEFHGGGIGVQVYFPFGN